MSNVVPITSSSIRDNGTSRPYWNSYPTMRPAPSGEIGYGQPISNVHRTYHGKVLVIIECGLQHGFVFEPGDVTLTYRAADGSHPRDPREMVMSITGPGRMAAVHELPSGVQDGHGNEQGNLQDQGHGHRQELEL